MQSTLPTDIDIDIAPITERCPVSAPVSSRKTDALLIERLVSFAEDMADMAELSLDGQDRQLIEAAVQRVRELRR